MVISAPTNPILAARRRTRCLHLSIVKVRHKCQAGCITTPHWLFTLEEWLPPYNMRDLWHGDRSSLSLPSQLLICWHLQPLFPPLSPLDWYQCQTFPLEWVPRLLVPEFWSLWLQQLLPWDMLQEFWSLQPLLPAEYIDHLWMLLQDLVPFAIVCVECCAGWRGVYPLCMYLGSTARHHLLHSIFLSPAA